MLLNSKSVANILKESKHSKRTQIGIDLSVCKVEKIVEGGLLLTDKTVLDPSFYIELPEDKFPEEVGGYEEYAGRIGWKLMKGTYSLTFNEGVEIPEGTTGFILQRSSIYRMGNTICSPVWDPGFKTEQMGTTLIVNNTFFLEKNARIAQFFLHQNMPVDELYDGQWQDKVNY